MLDLIVNYTPTGMIPTKSMTPHVPVRVREIVEDVHQAVELGITMVHLHARDERHETPTHQAEIYGRIIEGIRAFAPELVICVSLSGRNVTEFEKRAEPLELDLAQKPDMGSLTLSSLNFARSASINAPETVQALAARMLERGIVPELEIFDLGMVQIAHYLVRKGLLVPPHYANILLGNIAGAQADPLHAGLIVRDLPADTLWSLAGIGDAQLPMNALAIAMGGGVRIGLEDNIWHDPWRTRLATNHSLVQRVHALAAIHQRAVMPPSELRQRLNLAPGFGAYGRRPRFGWWTTPRQRRDESQRPHQDVQPRAIRRDDARERPDAAHRVRVGDRRQR
ncbi:MAG: 3-keto-5-aminohexanoate cleavage protein [Acidobacteria bacterium]|nr:3-keto-5-aminohexanoate cleavage protein [Acidobacteriota bacterium]